MSCLWWQPSSIKRTSKKRRLWCLPFISKWYDDSLLYCNHQRNEKQSNRDYCHHQYFCMMSRTSDCILEKIRHRQIAFLMLKTSLQQFSCLEHSSSFPLSIFEYLRIGHKNEEGDSTGYESGCDYWPLPRTSLSAIKYHWRIGQSTAIEAISEIIGNDRCYRLSLAIYNPCDVIWDDLLNFDLLSPWRNGNRLDKIRYELTKTETFWNSSLMRAW